MTSAKGTMILWLMVKKRIVNVVDCYYMELI